MSCSLVSSRAHARVRAVPGPSDNDNAGHQAYEDEGTESEWLAQDSKSHEGSSVGQPRGASPSTPPLGPGGTLVHSWAEWKQLEPVGNLAMGCVRKGLGWGFALTPYPADAYAPQWLDRLKTS